MTRAWIQPAGGGTKEGLRPDSDTSCLYLTDWSHDGKTLLISPRRIKTGQDVEVIHLDGDRTPVPLVHGPSDESVLEVTVRDGASFSASAARPVEALGEHIQAFTVARSGRIVALSEIDPGRPPLTIVRNWEQLLGGK